MTTLEADAAYQIAQAQAEINRALDMVARLTALVGQVRAAAGEVAAMRETNAEALAAYVSYTEGRNG